MAAMADIELLKAAEKALKQAQTEGPQQVLDQLKVHGRVIGYANACQMHFNGKTPEQLKGLAK